MRMWRFAFRNLLTRPARTGLALIGLSIPIVGVLGLLSLSAGMRNLLGETLGQVRGMLVLREDAPAPIFSHLRADLADSIRETPGVRLVLPEIWELAPPIEGVSLFRNLTNPENWTAPKKRMMGGIFDAAVVLGHGLDSPVKPRTSLFDRSIKAGRFLNSEDRGKRNVVISQKASKRYPNESGEPRGVGDSFRIGGETFQVIGIYDTGSMLFDDILIMDIEVARDLVGLASEQVSCFYVEAENPEEANQVARAIEAAVPGVDALSMDEFQSNFSSVLGDINRGLMLVVGLALAVGVVGIVNTMLMSAMERVAEFGVLRANGWTRGNVLALITTESAFLGLAAGVLGSLITLAAAAITNHFLTGGLHLSINPSLIGLSLALSVVMGTLGGVYPAWKASRLAPMDAIRAGAH